MGAICSLKVIVLDELIIGTLFKTKELPKKVKIIKANTRILISIKIKL
jgi:hypothetical protein